MPAAALGSRTGLPVLRHAAEHRLRRASSVAPKRGSFRPSDRSSAVSPGSIRSCDEERLFVTPADRLQVPGQPGEAFDRCGRVVDVGAAHARVVVGREHAEHGEDVLRDRRLQRRGDRARVGAELGRHLRVRRAAGARPEREQLRVVGKQRAVRVGDHAVALQAGERSTPVVDEAPPVVDGARRRRSASSLDDARRYLSNIHPTSGVTSRWK